MAKIKIEMHELGHEQEGNESGFDLNYTKNDISSSRELSCTVMGYELGEEAAILLSNRLSVYLVDCLSQRQKNLIALENKIS